MPISFTSLIDSYEQNLSQSTLYMLATPIGNLADITARALFILRAADVVCAEDTRVTGRLLSAYGIQAKKLMSLREHNECKVSAQIIHWLQQGLIVVQVSDAGTPTVSDPGARLAQAVHHAGFRVCPIPGASAVIAALSASGLTAPTFLFHGFLPHKSGERRRQLSQWQIATYTVVCYEAPHRIIDTLMDIVTELGNERIVVLARELTKLFETIKILPADAMLRWVSADPQQQRGEIVLLIAAAPTKQDHSELDHNTRHTLQILADELPTKQAAHLAAKLTGANKKILYEHALTIKAKKTLGHLEKS